MKGKQIYALMLTLCIVGAASATKILWVSQSPGNDYGFTDILLAEGYTVDRMVNPGVMDASQQALANTYDLIIIGRHISSGDYIGTGEVDLWNGISKPLICTSAYLWRNTHWKWINHSSTTDVNTSVTANLVSDPVFAGVTLNASSQVAPFTANTTILATTNVGNGTLVASRATAGSEHVWIARWNTNDEFYPGSNQIAGGPRMAFACGRGGGTDGQYNLTDQGKMMFLNAVYQMSGATFDRKPIISAGSDRIVYANEAVQIDATVYDPEDAANIAWSLVGGPGAVVFSDSAAAAPEVTFTAKGTYVLKLTVSDTAHVVTDTATFHVRDAADHALIARWDFASLPEPNSLQDISGNGFTGIYHTTGASHEPNVIEGNMLGGSQAADMRAGTFYWEVENSYRTGDPNFGDLATGMTVSAWVNIANTSVGAPVIIGNGLDGWRFGVNVSRFNFVCLPIGMDINGPLAFDGQWHHVVGVFDGVNAQGRLYVDGQLSGTRDLPQGTLISRGTSYPTIQIGNRGDGDRPWKGLIDDIAVYNYALTEAEILALGGEGNRPLKITAGPDQTVAYKGEPVLMNAEMLIDDGMPAYATVSWSVIEVPAGVMLHQVIFSDATAVNPLVTFPNVGGLYKLRLTATDTETTLTDDVHITLVIPTCGDVISDGLGLVSDLSGPAGVPDCRVDIHDIAAIAADWLRCNDPADAGCEWAYQQ